MKILRFLATIFISIAGSISVAQTQTTPNLVGTTVNPAPAGTQYQWSGFTTTNSTGGGFSGGNIPGYNPSTGQFMFGYMQSTIGYTVAINSALSGTGIQIGGMEYGLTYYNQADYVGTLSVTASVHSSTGSTLQSYTHSLPQTTNGWTQWGQSQTFVNQYSLSTLGNATLSFDGKDNKFWAGYYGPQFKDPYLRFTYTVDPCAGNPRYSPSCAGYSNSDMWYTGDLTSVYGTTFAIQQALGFGNTGVRVHSVNWGYDYSIGGQRCVWDILGLCMEWANSSVGGSMSIFNSNNQQIAYDTNSHSGQNVSGSFRREVLLGATSPDISTLGNATISTWVNGNASATPYLGFNFTPDICNTNPLTSSQCPGYAAAYLTQQCTANPLYDSSCPGYAQALFNQQCTANPLFNQACPGYAAAYLTQQCTANPLYSPSCPGYQQAYFNQQCTANPLYDSGCTNYQTASAQCSVNPLYAAYCPGYQSALTSCTTNGLVYSYCPTYQSELNYCSTDPLSNNLCPTYQTAVSQCMVNPLTGAYCPNYQTAAASCSSNSLNHSFCPGYQTAQNTCSTNPLSNTLCSGYQTAASACSANSLSYSYCPNYASTLNTCSTNPLSNPLCPGYTTATNACSANSLTYTYCPNYTSALSSCSTNPQSNTMCPGYSPSASSGGGSSGGGIMTSAAVSTTQPTVQVANDGKVTTEVAVVSDSNVNSVITEKATSTAPSPTATVNLTPQPSAQSPAAPTSISSAETKKEETKTADSSSSKEEKKEETKTSDSGSSTAGSSTASSSEQKKDQPKTARQELQERRIEAARAKAIEDGKQLAGKMGEAATLESQVAVQNVVIQAMGFTPGFDTYGKVMLPDAAGYRPFEIYRGQRNIDNPAGRRFMTGSDRLHAEMVDQQYNRER